MGMPEGALIEEVQANEVGLGKMRLDHHKKKAGERTAPPPIKHV
jgi:hypothetical protein